MLIRAILAALISVAAPALAEPENTHWPNYQEGDFIIPNYKFASSETLPQLKLHYRTLGSAERNAAGEIVDGVLLLQGNTGTGANWLRPTLAEELFKDGQPLDAGRYFIIIPDALGRGGSSKPSDGSKAVSRTTVITTWLTPRTGWSLKGSRSLISASSSAARWAACTVFCGPRCIPT
jgi:homoserine O-acetyltransferase/O-succinyltransferase